MAAPLVSACLGFGIFFFGTQNENFDVGFLMLVNASSFTQGVVNRFVLCQLSSFTCIVAGVCVMVGCDFLPSMRTVGVSKALALLAKHGKLQGAHVLLLLSLCTSVL